MENLTLVGMKDLNQRLARIDRSLDSIAKSLETLVKIQNRQNSLKAGLISLSQAITDDEEEE